MPANTKALERNQPKSDTDFVWRYMDLSRFIAFLHSRSLHFSRPDQFEDPLEGFVRRDLPVDIGKASLTIGEKRTKEYPLHEWAIFANKWRYINCWHLNNFESAAMWKLYGKNNDSVAIKTTYKNLVNCLPETIEIGEVGYLDFEEMWMPYFGSLSESLMHKRKSFSHENEVRLILCPSIPILPDGEPDFLKESAHKAYRLNVNPQNLIDEIYVSPHAEPWFYEVIQSVVEKYGLISKKIIQSSLYQGLT